MCELDGSYAKVRKNETHYFCSDKSGMAIGNYSVELSDALSDRINCSKYFAYGHKMYFL